jgi:transposase-like protein
MVGRMSLSQEDWEGLVAEWRRSGKSASRFAEEHGLPATALRYWINRPPTRNSRPKVTAAKLTSARVVESSVATPSLARVVRPGDAPSVDRSSEVRVVVGKVTIVVEPGFDDVHLRAVVRALSELG